MTKTETGKHLDTIIEAAAEIKRNARLVEAERNRKPQGWHGVDVGGVRGKLLMELHHDLEDALKAVKALDDAEY